MLSDNDSANAHAPLVIVNTRGFDLPQTGDSGAWMFGAAGITMMASALLIFLLAFKKKDEEQKQTA
jgi:LPXTG-motif cell wall-anchored protein